MTRIKKRSQVTPTFPCQVRVQEGEGESGQERTLPEPRGRHLLHSHQRAHARHVHGPHRVLLQSQLRKQEVQGPYVRRDEEQGEAGAVRGPGHRQDCSLPGHLGLMRLLGGRQTSGALEHFVTRWRSRTCQEQPRQCAEDSST